MQGLPEADVHPFDDDAGFETPLVTWAVYLSRTSHSNGISALQLQKQLALGSYRTAWLLLGKLRAAMDPGNLLSGLVEIDETSIRCRTKNDEVRRGRSHEGKLMIAGAVEVIDRDGKTHPGRIRLSEIPDYTTETLHDFGARLLTATVKTDGLPPQQHLEGTNRQAGWRATGP